MKLTREEAIRLHREMWTWIAEEEAKLGPDYVPTSVSRHNLKKKYLILNDMNPEDVLEYCFLCEYANDEFLNNDNITHRCQACPLSWNSMRETYPCDYEDINWIDAPASVIANLLERVS